MLDVGWMEMVTVRPTTSPWHLLLGWWRRQWGWWLLLLLLWWWWMMGLAPIHVLPRRWLSFVSARLQERPGAGGWMMERLVHGGGGLLCGVHHGAFGRAWFVTQRLSV